jgi:hypothetical protein
MQLFENGEWGMGNGDDNIDFRHKLSGGSPPPRRKITPP